ncbi:hypothetical protein IV203_030786 [Nitzschia inconspicua]|uniref:Uncharacterized protein n=1 Tax=Nitzschia inconspicua TaxID=303405 RepID=A0A9K3LU80_9STRA|nr:hypothetical protein IV203_030786 [Nitzschia inconspicua]
MNSHLPPLHRENAKRNRSSKVVEAAALFAASDVDQMQRNVYNLESQNRRTNTGKACDGKQVWTTVRPNHNSGTNSCGTGHFDACGRISKEPELNAKDLIALKTCRSSKNMVKNMVNQIAVQ